jgi:hypothetical protein
MSKGDKKRGNREAKKPKKVKEKVVATADFTKGKALTNLGEHKKKRAQEEIGSGRNAPS